MAQRIHHLKTWPIPFTAVKELCKTFEIRINDRDYSVGDLLILQEYLPTNGQYTGKEVERVVTYIADGEHFGLQKGFVALGIEPVKPLK